MAKYQITHTCGHTVEHAIAGVVANRDGQAQRLAAQLCTDCYRAQQRAAAAAETADLPALTGTEKQIAWALTIRAKAAKALRSLREQVQPYAAKGDAEAVKAVAIIDSALSCADAGQWITARDAIFDRRWLAKKLGK